MKFVLTMKKLFSGYDVGLFIRPHISGIVEPPKNREQRRYENKLLKRRYKYK